MIYVERELYDECAKALLDKDERIFVTGSFVLAPSRFPCVSIVQTQSYTAADRLDSSDEENASIIGFEVNIYSNKETGAKAQCMELAYLVDKVMFSRNMSRNLLAPVQNADPTVTRYVARYVGMVDKNKTLYRR